MKTKPIRIEWDDLEDAFNNQRAEVVAFLDRITGRVLLEGEGEADDHDDEGAGYGGHTSGGPRPVPEDDGTRLYVRPPDTPRKVGWLKQFLSEDQEVDAEVSSELNEAMTIDDPAPELRAILNRNPEVRDAWFRYRSERTQGMIDDWLEDNGVAFVDPPPWKS